MKFYLEQFICILFSVALTLILALAVTFVTAENKIKNYYIRTMPNQTEIIYHVVGNVDWREDHCAFTTKDFKEAKAQYEYLTSTLPKQDK